MKTAVASPRFRRHRRTHQINRCLSPLCSYVSCACFRKRLDSAFRRLLRAIPTMYDRSPRPEPPLMWEDQLCQVENRQRAHPYIRYGARVHFSKMIGSACDLHLRALNNDWSFGANPFECIESRTVIPICEFLPCQLQKLLVASRKNKLSPLCFWIVQ